MEGIIDLGESRAERPLVAASSPNFVFYARRSG
jgi:hypothetical protein